MRLKGPTSRSSPDNVVGVYYWCAVCVERITCAFQRQFAGSGGPQVNFSLFELSGLIWAHSVHPNHSFPHTILIHQNRNTILKEYPRFKKANPNMPFLIRESPHVEARVFARYGIAPLVVARRFWSCIPQAHLLNTDRGKERYLNFENASEVQVQNGLLDLINKAPSS